MNTTVTSRHFKAHETMVEYAEGAVAKLERYYDGILKCEVKLSFEKARNSVKVAEIILTVYKTKITSMQTSDDFNKSIDYFLCDLCYIHFCYVWVDMFQESLCNTGIRGFRASGVLN